MVTTLVLVLTKYEKKRIVTSYFFANNFLCNYLN